jgi:excisionase family DNA binding protein
MAAPLIGLKWRTAVRSQNQLLNLAENDSLTETPWKRAEPLLNVCEAARYVGCCEETIRRAYLSRQLQVLRFGARSVRIRLSALVAWLDHGGKTAA